MNDILASISQWFRDKTTSPFYGTYLASLLFWNWKFFYVLFFQDQIALSIPKIEYIEQNFLIAKSFCLPKLFCFPPDVSHFFIFFLPPIIFSFLAIKYLPIVTNWAYEIHSDFHFKRKHIWDNKYSAYQELNKQNLTKLQNIFSEQAIAKKQIERSLDPELKWEIEYEEFKSKKSFSEFGSFLDLIYKENGWISDFIKNHPTSPADFHVRGLIEFISDNNFRVRLTDKGKFFAKKLFSS